jgi:hypothetical protein
MNIPTLYIINIVIGLYNIVDDLEIVDILIDELF